MRFIAALLCLGLASSSRGQSLPLPDAPQPSNNVLTASVSVPDEAPSSSSAASAARSGFTVPADGQESDQATQAGPTAQERNDGKPAPKQNSNVPVDANGNRGPLNRQQPKRILGFMPNFRSVSGGIAPHPLGWKYNFSIASHQSLDYSTFIFLGLTSLTAEGMNSHPALGKGADGFYAYTWRGFLDKTDGTYLSAWLLPSILHEDTRYYALGPGHSILVRSLYIISRQAVARTYGGSQTPNVAGLGGKVLTQVISRNYYPPSAANFDVLATKFAYASMRDIGFSAIREFYPDIAAHYIQKHREKAARQAALDAGATSPSPSP